MDNAVVTVLILAALSRADSVLYPEHTFRVVCYMSFDERNFTVADAEAALPMCTHLVYNYLRINDSDFRVYSVKPTRDYGDDGISQMVAFKQKFPYMKTMIGVGGPDRDSRYYSLMAAESRNRANFVEKVVDFVLENKLDGMDLDWRTPGYLEDDRITFVQLVNELRHEFDKHYLLLSLTLPSILSEALGGIEPRGLAKYADFLNVRTLSHTSTAFYDLRSEIKLTAKFYQSAGVRPEKLNFGVAFVRKEDTYKRPLSASISNSCDLETFEVLGVWSNETVDVNALVEGGLGGVAFYGLEKDDFLGECATSKGRYPLLREIDETLVKVATAAYHDYFESIGQYDSRFWWNSQINRISSVYESTGWAAESGFEDEDGIKVTIGAATAPKPRISVSLYGSVQTFVGNGSESEVFSYMNPWQLNP